MTPIYSTTLSHERRHIDIFGEHWDNLADRVNFYHEYKYCKLSCAKARLAWMYARNKIHYGLALIENGEFDSDEYGGGQSVIAAGEAYLKAGQDELDKADQLLESGDCFSDTCE